MERKQEWNSTQQLALIFVSVSFHKLSNLQQNIHTTFTFNNNNNKVVTKAALQSLSNTKLHNNTNKIHQGTQITSQVLFLNIFH